MLKLVGWKIRHQATRDSYNHLRHILKRHYDVPSEYRALKKLSGLSGITPVSVHCCVNSCHAYTGKYEALVECSYCKEPRYTQKGQPRNHFLYIPLIPRLEAFFRNREMIQRMSYRHDFRHNHDLIEDFFSTDRYQDLLRSRVQIQDEKGDIHTLSHCHFSDRRDIALAVYSDGVQLFKRSKVQKSCTPILLTNMNLSPEIRTLLENLICLRIVPGPHSPKDINSFFYPAYLELLKLACGHSTIDILASERFNLHAYVILHAGDLPDMAKWLGYKGAGAKSPCMECDIIGVRILAMDNVLRASTNYYVPLKPPSTHPPPHIVWNPHQLPLRTDSTTVERLEEI